MTILRQKNSTTKTPSSSGNIEMQFKHGHISAKMGYPKGSRTYICWASMRCRCLTKTSSSYSKYKKFKICKRWNSFQNFLDDMGECPIGKTLDRIDNIKGYNKKNCRWATYREQAQNRQNSIFITYNGMTKNLAEWARISKIEYETLRKRYKRGVELPVLLSKKRISSKNWIRS